MDTYYTLFDEKSNSIYNRRLILNTREAAELKQKQLKSSSTKLVIVACDKNGNIDGYNGETVKNKVLILLRKDNSVIIPATDAAKITEIYNKLIEADYTPSELKLVSDIEYQALTNPDIMKKANQPKEPENNAVKKAIQAAEKPNKRATMFKSKKNPDKTITAFKFYLDVEMLDKLRAAAKSKNVGIGEYIRNAITEYFNK